MDILKGPVHRPLASDRGGDCLFAASTQKHLDGSLHFPLLSVMLLNRWYRIQPCFGDVKEFLQGKKINN